MNSVSFLAQTLTENYNFSHKSSFGIKAFSKGSEELPTPPLAYNIKDSPSRHVAHDEICIQVAWLKRKHSKLSVTLYQAMCYITGQKFLFLLR